MKRKTSRGSKKPEKGQKSGTSSRRERRRSRSKKDQKSAEKVKRGNTLEKGFSAFKKRLKTRKKYMLITKELLKKKIQETHQDWKIEIPQNLVALMKKTQKKFLKFSLKIITDIGNLWNSLCSKGKIRALAVVSRVYEMMLEYIVSKDWDFEVKEFANKNN